MSERSSTGRAETGRLKNKFIDPVHVPLAHELAVEHTIEAIERMYLQSGDKLPSEAEFARELGLSRPTIRVALKVLKEAGFISMRKGNGGGVFLESDLLPVIVFPSHQFCEDEIADILEARRTLEGAITHLATQKANKDDFASIERAIDLMLRHVNDFESIMLADEMFHRAVHRAAHNRTLERTIRVIRRPLNAIRKQYVTPRVDIALNVNLCIRQLEAMRRRDFEAVESILDEHLSIMENDFAAKVTKKKFPDQTGD